MAFRPHPPDFSARPAKSSAAAVRVLMEEFRMEPSYREDGNEYASQGGREERGVCRCGVAIR